MSKKPKSPPVEIPRGIFEHGYLKAMPGYVFKVYAILLSYRNIKNSSAWPSLKTLSEKTGYPINKITRATNWLDKLGVISKRKGPKETGFASVYSIKMNLEKNPRLENINPLTVPRWIKGGAKSRFLKKKPLTVPRWIKDTEEKKTQNGAPEDENLLCSPSSGDTLSPSSGDTELKEKELKARKKNDGLVHKVKGQKIASIEVLNALRVTMSDGEIKTYLDKHGYTEEERKTIEPGGKSNSEKHAGEASQPNQRKKKSKPSAMKKTKKAKPKKTRKPKPGFKPHERTTALKELGEISDVSDLN